MTHSRPIALVENDIEHHRAIAAFSRAAADLSTCPQVRRDFLEMADERDAEVRSLEASLEIA